MINIFKKNNNIETVYTVDSLPYIYQSEFYSLAWGLVHKGFYVDPRGITYKYNMPKDWKFYKSEMQLENYKRRVEDARNIIDKDAIEYGKIKHIDEVDYSHITPNGYETDGTIRPEDLFQNLQNSSKYVGMFGALRKHNPISQIIIDDLKGSNIEDSGFIRCDAGNLSNVLLIYESKIQLYRRIVLTNNGERDMVNRSQYIMAIIKALGQV
jgi:hypothetical protein